MSGDGVLDGGISASGGDGALGAGDGVLGAGDGVLGAGPGKVRTMGGGGEGGLSMFGMKSANKFLARANGSEGRPKAESSDGIGTRGPNLPRPTG